VVVTIRDPKLVNHVTKTRARLDAIGGLASHHGELGRVARTRERCEFCDWLVRRVLRVASDVGWYAT